MLPKNELRIRLFEAGLGLGGAVQCGTLLRPAAPH
jgi:hypothetical protein